VDTSPGSYQPDGVGGGIVNEGRLTLTDCTVSFNYSNFVAGGIYNEGTLTVSSCTVTGNSADFEGGGIYNDTSGTVTIEVSSTITGNNAADAYNLGVLYLDSTSTIGTLDGNPAIPISSSQPGIVQTGEANNWMGVGPAVEVLNS